MKKLLSILVAVVVVPGAHGLAQSTDALPPGPLIVTTMPEMSQWTIDYVYTDAPKAGVDSPLLARFKELAKTDPSVAQEMANPNFVYSLSPARPLHVLVVQTGNVRHEERQLEQGLTSELWHSGSVTVEREPESPRLDATIDYSQSLEIFPEFSWISRSDFTGIESRGGQACLVFKKDVEPVSISHPGTTGNGTTVPAVAYIDVKTHYPVSLQFGVETRQYTFLPPPTSPLAMPPDFQAAAQALNDRIQKAIPHLSPP